MAEQILFNITGSQQHPARNISIAGLTLRDTVQTYFEAHGLPSGGDWALQRTGAIVLVRIDDTSDPPLSRG